MLQNLHKIENLITLISIDRDHGICNSAPIIYSKNTLIYQYDSILRTHSLPTDKNLISSVYN